MNISHVIRGEDHISNTAKQILIFKALNFKLPIFSHTPLILNTEGKKLSKRDCVTSMMNLKRWVTYLRPLQIMAFWGGQKTSEKKYYPYQKFQKFLIYQI